jgi:endonuclease-3
MRAALDLHSHNAIHRIILDAAKAVDAARRKDPTALQEISDSTDGNPFRVLIATVLSHRTKDPVTALASSRLFAKFPDVESLAKANTRTVARLIKPVGFYNTKARTVKKISKILLAKYGGIVPEDMDKLLELPSVGRKTANCVFVYGFKTPAIPVDTHVHRIFNRIGVVETKTPEETEMELTRLADRKDWLPLNEVFVKFGQLVCRPIGPHCSECPLNDRCKYYKTDYLPRTVKTSRKNTSKRARTGGKPNRAQ